MSWRRCVRAWAASARLRRRCAPSGSTIALNRSRSASPIASRASRVTSPVVFMPIRELQTLVQTRQVSPVELAETFLARLETLGPQYNAVVTVTRELALQQAQQAERDIAAGHYRGPLHGIPYGAKDLLATSGGIPTTWGAAPFRERRFDYDATVIRRLEDAGAVTARWRSAGRSTSSVHWRSRPTTAGSCSTRSPAQIPPIPARQRGRTA